MRIDLISAQGILCCLAFFFAGVVDSISGGGGLITIPVMLATGIPVHYITGTNQCSAWLGTGVAAYKYIKSGKVHFPSALVTVPFAVVGAFLGARLNLMLPERALKLFMLVSIPVLAVILLSNKKLGEADRADEQPASRVTVCSALIGLVLGAYRAFTAPAPACFSCWPTRPF